MSVTIKMYDKKWQMIIDGECWQFEDQTDLIKTIEDIIAKKGEFGRIK